MNVLFLTVSRINSINDRGIYTDLLRYFIKEGHKVFIASPIERRYKQPTSLSKFDGGQLLKVKTLNVQKTNFIEKGISTLLIDGQFNKAIAKHFHDVKFDLILYSTPPITFVNTITKIKRNYNAKSYLLLKDIFPQNAVDLGLINKKGLLYRYFKRKEKQLYLLSDFIGCMSPANVKYVINNNPFLSEEIIEECPNSIEVVDVDIEHFKKDIRVKYNICTNKTIYMYGGNLGKPQGLSFLLEVLESQKDNTENFFFIVGSGTEFSKIKKWFDDNKPTNALLFSQLPKKKYDALVSGCDVGLVFLDPRFTIPNYPSRILSYMENKIPILVASDLNTDLGSIAEKNKYGFWCESGNLTKFTEFIEILSSDIKLRQKMGKNGYQYLLSKYTVKHSYNIIMNRFNYDIIYIY